MRRLVICALALCGFAASAQAADLGLDSLKDPLPDTLTYKGVTIYGTIDVGYGYQTNGLGYSGVNGAGQGYNVFSESKALGTNSGLTNNALSQSQIGVKVEESIGMGFVALGRIDTGFNPLSGELADSCASLVQAGNAIKNGAPVAMFADGSRCGQAINGEGYAGLSNAAFGTLTVGRQNSLDLDAMAKYDPMALSYALSLIGYSGTPGAGVGSTETARWDNSLKYVYQYGPVHAGVMYANGAEGSSLHGDSVAANIGGAYKGFSADAVYTNEKGAVNATIGDTTVCGANNANCLKFFNTDNEAYSVMAKYTMELGEGVKDGAPNAKRTFYGGYQHVDQTQASSSEQFGTTTGGYQLTTLNWALTSTRSMDTEWAGVKYDTGPWALTAAYYHWSQDDWAGKFNGSAAKSCAANHDFTCAGADNTASLLVDYTFNKHFDMYAGVEYSNLTGGLAYAAATDTKYLATDSTSVVTGMRLKF